MRWPTNNPHVSSPFGMRVHPVTGVKTLHAGADFPLPASGDLYAIAPMKITSRGWSASGGNYVFGTLPDGNQARYYHMKAPSPLRVGDEVAEGAVVGQMGMTGAYVTGVHVHFEVRTPNGTPIDPVAYLRGGTASVGGGTPLPIPESLTKGRKMPIIIRKGRTGEILVIPEGGPYSSIASKTEHQRIRNAVEVYNAQQKTSGRPQVNPVPTWEELGAGKYDFADDDVNRLIAYQGSHAPGKG